MPGPQVDDWRAPDGWRRAPQRRDPTPPTPAAEDPVFRRWRSKRLQEPQPRFGISQPAGERVGLGNSPDLFGVWSPNNLVPVYVRRQNREQPERNRQRWAEQAFSRYRVKCALRHAWLVCFDISAGPAPRFSAPHPQHHLRYLAGGRFGPDRPWLAVSTGYRGLLPLFSLIRSKSLELVPAATSAKSLSGPAGPRPTWLLRCCRR